MANQAVCFPLVQSGCVQLLILGPQECPHFFFAIHEMRPSSRAAGSYDAYGRWRLPKDYGDNRACNGQTRGKYYYCDGQSNREVTAAFLPTASHFRTYSAYYSQGKIYVVDYDATRQRVGDGQPAYGASSDSGSNASSSRDTDESNWAGWQALNFMHTPGVSSFACLAGNRERVASMGPNSAWATRLLPPANRATHVTAYGAGGLKGHLPLLLALIVLGYHRQHSDWALRNLFRNGGWDLRGDENASTSTSCCAALLQAHG